jgi:hypothetical protein
MTPLNLYDILKPVPYSPASVGHNLSRSSGLPVLIGLMVFQIEQASASSIAQLIKVSFTSPIFNH